MVSSLFVFIKKKWDFLRDLQVELKKQQKFFDLEKENLLRKSQQYEDLLQEYRSLKVIHENLKSKQFEIKYFNKENQSPVLRHTCHPFNRSSKEQKSLLITKPVLFQENLFSKTFFTKANESVDGKEIKM